MENKDTKAVICPIMSAYDSYGEVVDCWEEQCAWWTGSPSGNRSMCSIRRMALDLEMLRIYNEPQRTYGGPR